VTVLPRATLVPAAGDCLDTTPRRAYALVARVTWTRNPLSLSLRTASPSRSPTTKGTARGKGGATVTVIVVVCAPQAEVSIAIASGSTIAWPYLLTGTEKSQRKQSGWSSVRVPREASCDLRRSDVCSVLQ
jgi:hypothetical protein